MTHDPERLPALDDADGPALPISEARARAMVDAALATALDGPAFDGPALDEPPRATPLRPRAPRVALLVAVAITLLAAAALAAWGGSGVWTGLTDALGPSPAEPTRSTTTGPTTTEPTTTPATTTEPTTTQATTTEPTTTQATTTEPTTTEPTTPPPLTAEPMPDVEATPDDPTAAPAPSDLGGAAAPSRRELEDLLLVANRLRAEQRWVQADRTYAQIIRAAPRSSEAYVASVARGTVRLSRLDDARTARREFERALRLRPEGALSEEARYGLAVVERRLHAPVRERRALEGYLASHPRGMRAAAARARLAELAERADP